MKRSFHSATMTRLRHLLLHLTLLIFAAVAGAPSWAMPTVMVTVEGFESNVPGLNQHPTTGPSPRAPPKTGGNVTFTSAPIADQANGTHMQGHGIHVASLGFDVGFVASNRGTWTVDPTFRSADEAAGVLVNGSYIRNPTARNLSDSVTASGKVRVDGQLANGQYMYVVDTSGNIVIGTRGGQRMPHPTLIGGSNPQVQAAGIVDIRGGKIYSVDNASGHFKPGNGSLQNAENAFGNLPGNSFHTDFQGYVPFDG